LCNFANDFINIYTQNFDYPYALIGLQTNYYVQLSC
jgi:hypothetical protein